MGKTFLKTLAGNLKASKSGAKSLIKSVVACKYQKSFEENKKFTKRDFNNFQERKLEEMIDHCVKNVSYYRNHCEDYIKHNTPLALHELPVLNKSFVKKNNSAFHAERGAGFCFKHATSGTSGTPLIIKASYKIYSMAEAGCVRHTKAFGIQSRSKVACLTGFFRPPNNQSEKIAWYDYVGNRVFLSIYKLSDEYIKRYHQILTDFKPESLFGYASNIYLLAAAFKRNNLNPPDSLKVVLTTSEVLYPHWREVILDSFKVPVADRYGSQELQCMVTECPHGKMHVNPEFGIVEIVDANYKPVDIGKEGKILLTGLANKGMPLIRYDIGDQSSMEKMEAPCACGLCWPIIGPIKGRSEDAIITPDGRPLMYLNFHCTEFIKGVVESQFVQDAEDHLTIKFVIDEHYNEESERVIVADIRNRSQFDFKVDFEYLDEIPRGSRGKFKAVINLLNKS